MPSSLVHDLARHCSEVPTPIDPVSDWLPQIVVLTDELAQVTDPRRRQSRRHDLVFLLLVLPMAVLGGASSLAQVLRWAHGVHPDVLTALAAGGPTAIPTHSTFSRLLSRLDGDELDDARQRPLPRPTRSSTPTARSHHVRTQRPWVTCRRRCSLAVGGRGLVGRRELCRWALQRCFELTI